MSIPKAFYETTFPEKHKLLSNLEREYASKDFAKNYNISEELTKRIYSAISENFANRRLCWHDLDAAVSKVTRNVKELKDHHRIIMNIELSNALARASDLLRARH